MNKNYVTPQIEVIEIQIESAILKPSYEMNYSEGTGFGDEFFMKN